MVDKTKVEDWIDKAYRPEIHKLKQGWGTDGYDEVIRRMLVKLDNKQFPSDGDLKIASYNTFTEVLRKYILEREKAND